MFVACEVLVWSCDRQRKAISPAFSNVAIRRLTSIFYDSVYKVGYACQSVRRVATLTFYQLKTNWDNQLASVDSALIDVQNWYASLGHLSLHLCSLSLAG